ncbi:hypothetical protein [Vibrio phage vB_VhaS-a]|nr:hypothetical protein [Vibrio phage vB_VhaS-a]
MEFNGGGFRPMVGTLDDVKNTFDELMYAIAGEVAPPELIADLSEDGKICQCYELGKARGVILFGYKNNPAKDFLEGA